MQYTLLNDTKLCYLKLWELLKDDDAFVDTPVVSVKEEWFYQKLDMAIERAMNHGESSPLYETILMPVQHLAESDSVLVEPTLSLQLAYSLDIGDQVINLPYIRYNITLIVK